MPYGNEQPQRHRRLDRLLDVGEATTAALIGAAAGLSADPGVTIAGATIAPGIAAVLRSQLDVALAELRGLRSDHFASVVMEVSGLDPAGVAARTRERPELGALVEQGLDDAARCPHEDKRQLLGRVVGAAFRAPDDARLDEFAVLRETVAALEPRDVRMLVRISMPRMGEGQFEGHVVFGAVPERHLAAEMDEGQHDLLGPILAKLEREHLIERLVIDGGGEPLPTYGVSEYGRRLLSHIAADDAQFQHASLKVTASAHTLQGSWLRIGNLGPAHATVLALHFSGRELPAPFELAVGDTRMIAGSEWSSSPMTYVVQWRCPSGEEHEVRLP